MADRDFTERELRRLSRDEPEPGARRRLSLGIRRELIYLLAPSAAVLDRMFRRKTTKADLAPIGFTLGSGATVVGNMLMDVQGLLLLTPAVWIFAAWLYAFGIWIVKSPDEDRSALAQLVSNELKEIEREL